MPYNIEPITSPYGTKPPAPGRAIDKRFKIAIDRTLTKAGQAAEAQATGRAIQAVAEVMPSYIETLGDLKDTLEHIYVTMHEDETGVPLVTIDEDLENKIKQLEKRND